MKNKGNKIITALFYSLYFLLIVGFAVSMYFFHNWLVDQLVAFETATQPTIKSEEVFQALFADPDWGQLYEDSGLADTPFEGKDTFVAYMENAVGEQALSYSETLDVTGGHTYLVQLDDWTLGFFTLVNLADADDLIPDWEFGEVRLEIPKNQSVTVIKQDGHTAYVNGQPLDDSYTVEILSTAAEDYLPQGTLGIRMLRQEVTQLLVAPEVTVLDAEGNACALEYDEETCTYTETLPDAQPIPPELKDRAIAAGEAYCTYMVEQDNYQLFQYFAAGTDTYREITSARPWRQYSIESAFTEQSLSDYTRYTEDLFSARVAMTMTLTFGNGSTKDYFLDALFFFENRKDGWMVIAMTNEDITAETSRVRLTFVYNATELSTAFYACNDAEIYAPLIAAPDGQVLSGWTDGTITFSCDENGKLDIPDGTILTPMTLSPIFEDTTSESEETQ